MSKSFHAHAVPPSYTKQLLRGWVQVQVCAACLLQCPKFLPVSLTYSSLKGRNLGQIPAHLSAPLSFISLPELLRNQSAMRYGHSLGVFPHKLAFSLNWNELPPGCVNIFVVILFLPLPESWDIDKDCCYVKRTWKFENCWRLELIAFQTNVVYLAKRNTFTCLHFIFFFNVYSALCASTRDP